MRRAVSLRRGHAAGKDTRPLASGHHVQTGVLYTASLTLDVRGIDCLAPGATV